MDHEQANEPCHVGSPSQQACGDDACGLPCLLPGILARRERQKRLEVKDPATECTPEKVRKGVSFAFDFDLDISSLALKTSNSGTALHDMDSSDDIAQLEIPQQATLRRPLSLTVKSPSSCASHSYRLASLTPCTPDPSRLDVSYLRGHVQVIFFDFDGTLTRSAGSSAQRCRRQATLELCDRTALLAPRLKALRDANIVLGILSKSTKATITDALQEAGLSELFDGPIIGSAVGLEGKAGFIEDMIESGELSSVGALHETALFDDDVRELARCRALGIQTYAAPDEGGLQEEDFEEIFLRIGLTEGN